jgi:DNA-binding transcriptional MocR family regulator
MDYDCTDLADPTTYLSPSPQFVFVIELQRYFSSNVRRMRYLASAEWHLNSERILHTCLEQERVSYVIGQHFRVNGKGTHAHTLHLAFSNENEHNIRLGVEKLARVFKTQLE